MEENANNNEQVKGKASKVIDHTKWVFKIGWGSGVALVGAIIVAVFFYVQNDGYKKTIDNQGATIKTLSTTVSTLEKSVSALESANQTYNNTIQAFMENPPSAMKAQLDAINMMINFYHGNHYQPPMNTTIVRDTIVKPNVSLPSIGGINH